MTQDQPNCCVGPALDAVRHAIDVTIGSTGPNHPLREAERLLQRAEADIAGRADRALQTALRDLTEQLQPYADGARLLTFSAVEALERYVGRTDVLYRLSQRSSNKPPSRSSPLRSSPRMMRTRGSGVIDEPVPRYSTVGGLGEEIDEDLYAEVLAIFALEAQEQLQRLRVALRRLRSEPSDEAAKHEIFGQLRAMKGSAALVGLENVRLLSHASEDLAAVMLEFGVDHPEIERLERTCSALESLTVGDQAERSAVDVLGIVEGLGEQAAQLSGRSAVLTDVMEASGLATMPGPVPETPFKRPGGPASACDPQPDAPLRSSQEIDSGELEADRRLREALIGRAETLTSGRRTERDQLAKLNELVEGLEEARALVERRRFRFEEPSRGLRLTAARLRELSERVRTLGTSALEPEAGSGVDTDQSAPGDCATERLSEDLGVSAAELATLDLRWGFATSVLDDDLHKMRQLIYRLKEQVGRFQQTSLETLADRFHGTVHRAAVDREKEIELVLEGFEVSLDQGLIETVGESVVHLLKNAVQHGIESPNLRRLRDKPKGGVIRVSAQNLGPRLIIEVADDGAGLDLTSIQRAAARKGLVPAGPRDEVSMQQGWQLARLPGLSVASEQQGKGLDLVAALLERVAGQVSFDSVPHRGTTIRLQLPTDVTLTRGLVVERDGRAAAIPSAGVLRVTRLEEFSSRVEGPETVNAGAENPEAENPEAENAEGGAQGGGVVGSSSGAEHGRLAPDKVVFQGQEYDVLDLAACLGVELTEAARMASPSAALLLLQSEGSRRALLVDRVLDAGELAVYPAGPLLDRYPGVLGFALCAGDEVLAVLDPAVLAQRPVTTTEVALEGLRTPLVLVVDDVPSVRRVVGVLLERLGVETLLAADGKEALQLLELEPRAPSMALIDVEMSEMDGIALTRELRARGLTFPIYLFTSPSATVPPIDGLEVEGYVFKPLIKRELSALLRRHNLRRDRDDSGVGRSFGSTGCE